jgi:hypothetical protein
VYERSLNEAELILSTRKDPLVPVREVWEEVVGRSKAEGFEVASLIDFSTMLEGDQRFQIVPAQSKNQEELETPAEGEFADEEMENLGFFSEDRVRLRMARVIQPVVSEDEEEVGSIRRRAFVTQEAGSKNVSVKKESSKASKKSSKKISVKKKHSPKPKMVKRKKPALKRKSKTKKRGKK